MAASPAPANTSPVKDLHDAFEQTVSAYPKAEQSAIRKQWYGTVGKVKSAAELPNATRAFSRYLNDTQGRWDAAVEGSTLSARDKYKERERNRELLGPLREVTKAGFRVAAPTITETMTPAQRRVTDITLGTRRGSLLAALGATAADAITGSPFYVPPGYQEDTTTSGLSQALAMGAEFLIPGLGEVSAGKAIAAPAAVEAAMKGIQAVGRAAALPATKLAEIGGVGALKLAGVKGLPAGATWGQAIRSALQKQPGALQPLLNRIGTTGISGMGAGTTLGAFQSALPYIPAVRPATTQVDPATGQIVVERGAAPTLGDVAMGGAMGALGGGVGAIIPGMVGPTSRRLTAALTGGAAGLAALSPDALLQLAQTGRIDWGELAKQAPGAIASGALSAAAGPLAPRPAPQVPEAPVPPVAPPPESPVTQTAPPVVPPVAPEPVVPPAAPRPAGLADAKLPPNLSRATPRYNKAVLEFESDVDRALYIIANPKTKSSAHDEFVQWLTDTLPEGTTSADIVRMARDVRKRVSEQAKGTAAGEKVVLEPIAFPREKATAPEAPAESAAPASSAVSDLVDQLMAAERAGDYESVNRIWEQAAAQGIDEPTLRRDAAARYPNEVEPVEAEPEFDLATTISDLAEADKLDEARQLLESRRAEQGNDPQFQMLDSTIAQLSELQAARQGAPAATSEAPIASPIDADAARIVDMVKSENPDSIQALFAAFREHGRAAFMEALDRIPESKTVMDFLERDVPAPRKAKAPKTPAPAQEAPSAPPEPAVPAKEPAATSVSAEDVATIEALKKASRAAHGKDGKTVPTAMTKGKSGHGYVLKNLNEVKAGKITREEAMDNILQMLENDGMFNEDGQLRHSQADIQATYGITPDILEFLESGTPRAEGTFGPYEGEPVLYDPTDVQARAEQAMGDVVETVGGSAGRASVPRYKVYEGPPLQEVPGAENVERTSVRLGRVQLPDSFFARWLGTRNPDRTWLAVGLVDGTSLRVKKLPDETGKHPWYQLLVVPGGETRMVKKGYISTKEYNRFSQSQKMGGVQDPNQERWSRKLKMEALIERRKSLRSAFGLSNPTDVEGTFGPYEGPPVRYDPATIEARAQQALSGEITPVSEELPVITEEGVNAAIGSPFVAAAQWMNNSQGLQALRSAAQASVQTEPAPQLVPGGSVSSNVLTPAVEQALSAQQQNAPQSWAKAGAARATGEAARAVASLQNIKTRINRVARGISNAAINKSLESFGSSLRLGTDPDTLRSEAGTALVNYLDKASRGAVQFGIDMVNVGKRALGMQTAPAGQHLPPSLYDLREAQAQQIADGELAAARIEEYLATKYDSSILDQLEMILENGGQLPAPYDQDPILQSFAASLPTMMTQLEAIGAVRPDQVARAERFLVRTMAPEGTGFGATLKSLQRIIRGAGADPKLKMFAYGQGNVQQMPETEFLEYTRPWTEDPTQRTDTTMTLVSGSTQKVVSTVYNPATGTIEAADYVRWNPQTKDWENPWIEIDGAESGNVKAVRDWTTDELNANGIVRNLATTAFKTLSFWNQALARGEMYDAVVRNGGMLDGQLVAIKQADVRNPNMLDGGAANWSEPLRGKQWGSLQGYRVRQDVLDFVRNAQQEGRIIQQIEALAREYKRTRTTLSIGYALTNWLGNHGMLMLNGGSSADLPQALNLMINKSPLFQEFVRNGAYEGTTMQEMLRQRQRAGSEAGSVTEAALTGLGQKLDDLSTAMARKLIASLNGKPATAEALMAGLRDIGKTANPLVFNKFVDDLYRTALGVGVLREGGTVPGAVRRMREDMYSVMRPRTAAGRALTAAVFPWASWPIWALQNVPRVAAQNWQSATVNLLMLSAMAAVNEAWVFSGESDEERTKRREAEQAAAFTQTAFGMPNRLYLTRDVSLRTDTANPFEVFMQAADVLKSYGETGSLSEATGASQGFRKLPVRPSGPIVGAAALALGQNPLQPGKPLPESLADAADMALESAFPAATKLTRGLYNMQASSGEAESPEAIGALAQVARALGPFDVRNLDRDVASQIGAIRRIDRETNDRLAGLRRRMIDPYSGRRLSPEQYAEQVQEVHASRVRKQAAVYRKMEAILSYKATQQR